MKAASYREELSRIVEPDSYLYEFRSIKAASPAMFRKF